MDYYMQKIEVLNMKHFEVTLKIPMKAVCEENVEDWIENLVLPCLNEYCSNGDIFVDVDIKEI